MSGTRPYALLNSNPRGQTWVVLCSLVDGRVVRLVDGRVLRVTVSVRYNVHQRRGSDF